MIRLLGLIIMFLLFISGCTTAEAITGPDGTENQLISCPDISSCYKKATEVCGGSYKIVNTSTETSVYKGTGSTDSKLLVKCGK